jgi:hypothetical protein
MRAMRRAGLFLCLSLCAPSPPVFAEEPATKSYEQLLTAGRSALKMKDWAVAEQACKEALAAADEPTSGGPRSVRAAKLCAELEVDRRDWPAAVRRYRDAQRLALDDLAEHRRLLLLRKYAAKEAGRAPLVQLLEELLNADDDLQVALRRPERSGAGLQKTLASLATAQAAFAKDRDTGYLLLIKAVRVLVRARSGEAKEVRAEAERLVAEVLHRPARQAAVEAAFLGAEADGDVDATAELAIRLNQARNADLPERRRRYTRIRELERACRAYDQKNGVGACAKREFELTLSVSLVDYSRDRRRVELSADDLSRVHTQALPALQACVLRIARHEPERFVDTDLMLSWVIDPDGKPIEIGIAPKRYQEDLKGCAELIAWFRYPRVSSREPKSVQVPYHLD